MLGCVYITVNRINGRPYIGQTHYPIRKSYIGSGRVMKLAIIKYGKCNFDFNILEDFDSQDEIDRCEVDYISILRSYGADLYNVAPGGFRGGSGPLSAAHRNAVSRSLKGKKFSEAHRLALSRAQRLIPKDIKLKSVSKMRETMARLGMPPGRTGKKNSREHIEKIRLKRLGVPISRENLAKRLATNARKRELGLSKTGPRNGKEYAKYTKAWYDQMGITPKKMGRCKPCALGPNSMEAVVPSPA